MIIGVTGNYGAGKDSVADVLQDMNFFHVSLSDIIREELKRRKKSVTRENLIELGNKLREKYGPEVLARMASSTFLEGENYVITSIRNPSEVKFFERRRDFVLAKVTASERTRLERLRKRNREEDPKTIGELRKRELLENRKDPASQQLDVVSSMAKITITNDSTLETLRKKVGRVVNDWEPKLKIARPSWDEYFMNIARTVGERGTCDRGKNGCIIVRDRQILVTGYVGSPKGFPHCDEVGHLIKKTVHEDGHTSQHCVRTIHAEQNAICQAARLGISLNGATLYLKMAPCRVCAMMIINSNITRVVAEKRYHAGAESEEMFKAAGIKFEVLDQDIEKYDKQ